jgi:hypothetical protein
MERILEKSRVCADPVPREAPSKIRVIMAFGFMPS